MYETVIDVSKPLAVIAVAGTPSAVLLFLVLNNPIKAVPLGTAAPADNVPKLDKLKSTLLAKAKEPA